MDQKLKLEPLGRGVEIYTSAHHAFGTDAVLLSYFSKAKKTDKMIDLGTGCGIIPFILLRDKLLESAIGVDISREAIDLAKMSAEKNSFANFTAINSDLNDLKGKVEFGRSTLITCNPPYKADNAGIQNPDKIDRQARHEISCTMEDIVAVSARLLQTSGRLCMCQRPERLAELMSLMRKYKVEPKRLRLVTQRKGNAPWLFLLEGKRCAKTGLVIEPELYIEENGDFSEEMKGIYGAYKEAYL